MKTRSTQAYLSSTLLALTMTVGLWTIGAGWVQAAPTATPPVVVTLTVEKQVAATEKDGLPTWQPLRAAVVPGSILRYTVVGSSHLTHPLKKFVLNQPIPRGTEYLLASASATPSAVRLTASIDGGRTYSEKPTVKVTHPDGTVTDEPAPTSRYTNLRWTFLADLPALATASAQCQVRVR